MMSLTSVVFNVDFGPYAAGEMAGFVHPEAVRLCNSASKSATGATVPIAHLSTPEEVAALEAHAKRQPAAEPTVRVLILATDVGMYNRGDDPGLPESVASDLISRRLAMPHPDSVPEGPPARTRTKKSARRSPARAVVESAPVLK